MGEKFSILLLKTCIIVGGLLASWAEFPPECIENVSLKEFMAGFTGILLLLKVP